MHSCTRDLSLLLQETHNIGLTSGEISPIFIVVGTHFVCALNKNNAEFKKAAGRFREKVAGTPRFTGLCSNLV